MQPMEFEIRIQGTENSSWQGVVRYQEKELVFQSEIELILFIQKELERNAEK